jgi:uncharacterized protein
MEKQLSEKLPRVEVVDALRGFAVMAILLVHSLEHFIFPVYPVDQPAWLNILNDGVFNVTFTLLAGKSYAIFALLFGFTFYIQSANQQRKGKDFGYRFLWRLLLLVAFATLNAAFFPAGDVLLLFSVVGIVLFVVRKWSDCAILVTAILFLLQPRVPYFLEYIQVHLCQRLSNGPCLCPFNHHLQNCTCNKKSTKPTSKLNVYPQYGAR